MILVSCRLEEQRRWIIEDMDRLLHLVNSRIDSLTVAMGANGRPHSLHMVWVEAPPLVVGIWDGTVAIDRILSVINARAWVSIDFT